MVAFVTSTKKLQIKLNLLVIIAEQTVDTACWHSLWPIRQQGDFCSILINFLHSNCFFSFKSRIIITLQLFMQENRINSREKYLSSSKNYNTDNLKSLCTRSIQEPDTQIWSSTSKCSSNFSRLLLYNNGQFSAATSSGPGRSGHHYLICLLRSCIIETPIDQATPNDSIQSFGFTSHRTWSELCS